MASSTLRFVVGVVERGVNRLARLTEGEAPLVGTTDFPRLPQLDTWSCGLRCVQALCMHHGIDVSEDDIVDRLGTTRDGTSLTPIVRFLRDHGLRAGCHRAMSLRQLLRALERGAVVVVDFDGTHWAIATAASARYIWVSDSSLRYVRRRITKQLFMSRWTRLGVIVSEPSTR